MEYIRCMYKYCLVPYFLLRHFSVTVVAHGIVGMEYRRSPGVRGKLENTQGRARKFIEIQRISRDISLLLACQSLLAKIKPSYTSTPRGKRALGRAGFSE